MPCFMPLSSQQVIILFSSNYTVYFRNQTSDADTKMHAVLTGFLFILLAYRRADGSHFRGGLITWRPVNKTYSLTDNIQVIETNYKHFYKLQHSVQ